MERNILDFIEQHVTAVADLERDHNEARWRLLCADPNDGATIGTKGSELLRAHYSDREHYARVRTYDEEQLGSRPSTQRQIRLMRLAFTEFQIPPVIGQRIEEDERELRLLLHAHRAVVDGRVLAPDETCKVLAEGGDAAYRRAVWEAAHAIGDEVGPRLIRLAGIRNRAARDLGYRDWYHLSLSEQELDEPALIRQLDELLQATDDLYVRTKREVDTDLGTKFGTRLDELMPWHYAPPLFGRSFEDGHAFDRFYEGKDLVELATRFFDGIGFDVRPVVARSHFTARPGPSHAALCLHVDRRTDDVRVIAATIPSAAAMATLLAQLAQAAYALHLGPGLPFLLRRPPNQLVADAVGDVIGRLARSPEFLTELVGANKSSVTRLCRGAAPAARLEQIAHVRRIPAVAHFERALYEDPGSDLDRTWGDLSSRILRLPEAPDRHAHPDWACNHELTRTPVQCHRIVLRALIAAQLRAAIRDRTGSASLLGNVAGGAFLREHVFAPGASASWREIMARATGRPLDAKAYLDELEPE